jgi:hypothetical protein
MDTGAEGPAVGAAYFMIRVHPDPGHEPPRISGTIERLGTGEKLAFAGAGELIRLLDSWPGPAPKMPMAADGGNQPDRGS